MRQLAGYDVERAQRIIKWPLREALLSYVNYMREQAALNYRIDTIVWAVLAPYSEKGSNKPPRVPDILRGD